MNTFQRSQQKLTLELYVEDENRIISVTVDGLSTSCEILFQKVKQQVNAKHIQIYFQQKNKSENVDLRNPISRYYDVFSTNRIIVKKQIHFLIYINKIQVLESAFDSNVTIDNIISILNHQGYNIQQFNFSICDYLDNQIVLNIPGEEASQTIDQILTYRQPLYLYIDCHNMNWGKNLIQPFPQLELQNLQNELKKIELNIQEIYKTQLKQSDDVKNITISIEGLKHQQFQGSQNSQLRFNTAPQLPQLPQPNTFISQFNKGTPFQNSQIQADKKQ